MRLSQREKAVLLTDDSNHPCAGKPGFSYLCEAEIALGFADPKEIFVSVDDRISSSWTEKSALISLPSEKCMDFDFYLSDLVRRIGNGESLPVSLLFDSWSN
jgi:hypothetical protein